jgi:hypothetical protein
MLHRRVSKRKENERGSGRKERRARREMEGGGERKRGERQREGVITLSTTSRITCTSGVSNRIITPHILLWISSIQQKRHTLYQTRNVLEYKMNEERNERRKEERRKK